MEHNVKQVTIINNFNSSFNTTTMFTKIEGHKQLKAIAKRVNNEKFLCYRIDRTKKKPFCELLGTVVLFFTINVLIPPFKHISSHKFASSWSIDPNLHIQEPVIV